MCEKHHVIRDRSVELGEAAGDKDRTNPVKVYKMDTLNVDKGR